MGGKVAQDARRAAPDLLSASLTSNYRPKTSAQHDISAFLRDSGDMVAGEKNRGSEVQVKTSRG